MSQKDGFTGGFILGSLIGGVVGGLIGTIVSSRTNNRSQLPDSSDPKFTPENNLDSQENIELARRSLEDKIAQLNLAIDDVRGKLGNVESKNSTKE